MGEGTLLGDKLADLALLYQSQQSALREGYLEEEDALDRLSSRLSQSSYADRDVYLDGFDLLTVQLYSAIGALMEHCRSLTVSILSLIHILTAILYAAVCLPGILSGAGPYAAAQQYGEQIASRMTALAQTAYQDGAAAAQIMQESFDLLIQAIPSTLVGLLIFCSMAAGGCNVLLARALAKSAGAQLRPMAPFKAWRLDKSFLGGVAVLAVGALVLWLMDLSYSCLLYTSI